MHILRCDILLLKSIRSLLIKESSKRYISPRYYKFMNAAEKCCRNFEAEFIFLREKTLQIKENDRRSLP